MRRVVGFAISTMRAGITLFGFLVLPLAGVMGEDGPTHWAYLPATNPPLPSVSKTALIRNPIDLFIQARLEKEKLGPSPEADKRTLLRRVYHDLIGLPPSRSEAAEFLGDNDPLAYERLVDRLLDSPRYGERWARHWLDVVHYGETHGYDKDKPRPNAWPYRDYVIEAFNSDKPYSRFVQEQLAGDILFPDDPQATVATGFIAAGPWDFVGHVELPETKTDGLIARDNDRDDMVMTTMSTFTSLTVHCARCHDHKFDPISQRDYYGLQAVFAGVDRADREYDSDPEVFKKRKELNKERNELTRKEKRLSEQVASFSSPDLQSLDGKIQEFEAHLGKLPAVSVESPSNGYHSGIESQQDVTKWVEIDLGAILSLERVVLVPARPVDFPDTPGFGFPVRFKVEVRDNERSPFEDIVDQTASDYSNPGDAPFEILAGRKGRIVRVTATKLWERTKDYVFALGEVQVFVNGTNAALGSKVVAADSIEAGRWGKKFLVDNYDSRKPLQLEPGPAQLASERSRLEKQISELRERRAVTLRERLPGELRNALEATQSALRENEVQRKELPQPSLVYAAANDFPANGNFRSAKEPRPIHLLARGSVKLPRDLMAPAALSCVPGMEDELVIKNLADEGERRAALARWMTDPENLLTRRSIVNRVWQYHFGRGLVDTPNDFGLMGSQPTHPELLDWLAFWFLENGESLKKLHRLIVTSHTFRQTSAENSSFARSDAENRFLWRMNRIRLDAEVVRDSILALSDELELRMGGPSDQLFLFKDDHSPVYDYAQFDIDDARGNRRSIYRFIVRSAPDPFMDSLDCADPSLLVPKRNTTLTALQVLATLNNAFVVRQAEHFAARLERERTQSDEQIAFAYELALAREPSAVEMQKLGGYATDHGMAALCRLIFNLSEFTYID